MKSVEEVREYLRSRAKYLIVPNRGKYVPYAPEVEAVAKKVPIVPNSTYDTWSLNQHHFKPFYHFEYILPAFAELCNFKFSLEDFTKVERSSGPYDTTFLKPRRDYNFEVYGFSRQEHFENVDYTFLTTGTSGTDYHKQYRYYHECSRIINHSLDNSRILFVSGDSTLIPDVPVLACYFGEVWYFDNRNGQSYIGGLGKTGREVEVVFQMGFTSLESYCVNNLR